MRRCRFPILFVAVLALAACARAQSRQAVVQPAPADLDTMMYGDLAPARPLRGGKAVPIRYAPAQVAAVAADEPYTLDSGDKLRIVVFGQDALSNTYQVDANGTVAMPLIGILQARGLTTAQLSSTIAAKLRTSFIRDPSVAVEIETYRPFFILGEVTYPGQYPYVANMTVENAIAIAGGFTPRATRSKVTLTRKVQGVPTRFALPLNYPLRPGDTIAVGERWF